MLNVSENIPTYFVTYFVLRDILPGYRSMIDTQEICRYLAILIDFETDSAYRVLKWFPNF